MPVKTNTTSNDKPLTDNLVRQKKVLLEWEAPTRPYRKLDREVFSTVLAGAFLFGVILFFIDGAIPVIFLASVIFLVYVFGNVPPGKVRHIITNWGIESEDKSWPWETMARYWIQGQAQNKMLIIERQGGFHQHLRFMLGELQPNQLHDLLQQYLIMNQPRPNWLDKSSKWLESKIRLAPES